MKYLGIIKNRYGESIPMPDDIWCNTNYRFSLDYGPWVKIKSYRDLCMASVIEIAIVSEV